LINVQLLRHTPDPQRNIAAAARLCYSSIGASQLNETISDEEVAGLVRRLLSMGHMSAIEHASFTFAIEGISRACSHQLVRHRVASYSQQSQRYVQFQDSPDFIVPPGVKEKGCEEKFEKAFSEMFDLYKEMLSDGIEAEDARYILPQAVETKIVVTMNARELLHFFSLRCCDRAQWEIRELAMKMLDLVLDIAPVIYENSGPNCARTKCHEGKMTCGNPWDKRDWKETPYKSIAKKLKMKA
jgi:thymidylate synthase (FAD)